MWFINADENAMEFDFKTYGDLLGPNLEVSPKFFKVFNKNIDNKTKAWDDSRSQIEDLFERWEPPFHHLDSLPCECDE